MNADQVKILSERVVCEIFAQVFSAESGEVSEGVAAISWPKISDEELSRRIDTAVALSAEKLNKIRPDF
jgi:nitrite reductase/ring-hydroxylating ferredoxin subunit